MLTRLKKARKDLKLTQSQFAEKLGLSITAYNLIENGKNQLLDKHIKSICAIFDINEEWLRYGNGEEFDNTGITREITSIANKLCEPNKEYLYALARTMLEKQYEEYPDPSTTEEGE